MLRVLYCDIDGTLTRDGSLLRGEHGPTAASAEALVRLARAGIEVVPTTGRRVREMSGFCRMIGATSFVAELGAVVGLDGGKTLLTTYDPPGGVPANRALVEGGVVAHVLGTFSTKLEMHEPWARERDHTVLLRGLVDRKLVAKLLPKGVVIVDNGPIDRPADCRLSVPEVHSYHLTYEAVNKRNGVLFDRTRRGLAPEETAFVGDSEHDADMIGAVGRVVLLGEKADGADHVPRRYGEGFAEAIDMLLR